MGIIGLPDLYRMLGSQLFWEFLGLIFAAIAASGKLSMKLSAVLLAAAWVVGCLGIYQIETISYWPTKVSLGLSIGAGLTLLGWWLQPSKLPVEHHDSVAVPPLPLFEIEPPKWELYWRAVGTSSLVPFTPDPDNQPPESATVVLATETTITAIPTQHLEHIQLAIISQLLPPSPSSWLSTAISGERPCLFYFDVPSSLSQGPHSVHLVATTSLHGIIHQRPSPPFEIVLARTYQQLHRFRPQQFPLPS